MAKILIVEDDADNMEVIRLLLLARNHQVFTACSGMEGLSVALDAQPDLILLDLAMPNMDGWHAAQSLRRDPATQHIPILAVTARALPEDRRRAYAAGVDDYITKPIDTDAFYGAVTSLLNRSRKV